MKGLVCLVTVAVAAGGANAAAAQTADTQNTVADVVVTAQKRSTLLRETPLAVSAVSGADLQTQQVTTLEGLASRLPSLDVSRTTASTQLAIRGVGSIISNLGTESQVASHLDGVYLGRTWEALDSLFDIERIEYVRGPQGTLYGRNATAGAINFISRQPSATPNGYIQLGAGNYSAFKTEAAANVPLGEDWSVRLAGLYNRHSGFDRDVTSGRRVNGLETGAARASLKYEREALRLLLRANYSKEDDNSGAFVYGGDFRTDVGLTGVALGGHTTPAPNVATDPLGFPSTKRRSLGFTGEAGWTAGDNDFTLLASHRDSKSRINSDADLTDLPILSLNLVEKAKQDSIELRFHRSSEQYDFVAGLFYYQENVDGRSAVPINLLLFGGPNLVVQGISNGGEIKTRAYAAFSQLRWNFTPEFYADAGIRYSYERKTIDEFTTFDLASPLDFGNPSAPSATAQDRKTWNSFDPKITIGYNPSDQLLAYATISRGFKSGGYNLGGLQPPFSPEKITDYEAGLKWTSEDRTLSANFSAFYYDYSNLQAYKFVNNLIFVTNAAKARLKGLEAEVRWTPVTGLDLGAGAEVLDAKYKDYSDQDPARPELGVIDLSGNRLPQAPKFRIRGDATYSWDTGLGRWSIRGEVSHISRVYFSQFQQRSVSVPSSFEGNAFLTLEAGDWTAQVYARNLTDHRKYLYVNISSALNGFPILAMENAPRTYGLSLTRRW